MLTIPEIQAARHPRTLKPLACPHCGERLNRHAALVVTTRNCPACGRRVVADPEGEGTPPFTRETLDAACAAYARTTSRALWLVLAGFALCFATTFVLALFRDTIRDAVRPIVDSTPLFLVIVFGPCGATFVAAVLLSERARRDALKCPHCAAPCSVVAARVVPNVTQLTGNCGECGRKLVNDPPPSEDPAGPLPTVEEVKAADRRATRADWSMLAPVAAIVAMMVGLSLIDKPGGLWRFFEERYGLMDGTLIVTGLLCAWALGAAAIGFACLRWAMRRQRRRRAAEPALNCPHCKAALVAVPHVVASKRCPECRGRVLADPAV